MSRIRSRDTSPELVVRRMLHRLGYRYRLHARELPGKPDIVFRSRRKAIFVHGCFWHQHAACREGRVPASNRQYWLGKLACNTTRDREHLAALTAQGWDVCVVWECQLREVKLLEERIQAFLYSK